MTNSPKTYKTEIDFSTDWEIPAAEKYIFQYFHQQLENLEANQLHIHGVKLYTVDSGIVVTAIIRHSLPKKLRLEQVVLVVKDKEGKELAKKQFDMELFGELEACTARPWNFLFEMEDILVPYDEIVNEMDFEMAFEYYEKVVKDFELHLDDYWKNGLNEDQQGYVHNLVSTLEPIKENEISIVGFHFHESDDAVNIYIIIRNAFSNTLTIENLPIQLFDAADDMVCKLGFPIGQFEIASKQARPISLSFSKDVFMKENPDFSSWRIELVPQTL
ncbi:SLAP domain-containing protein [Psychrobacillus psychrodurans]|uniref:SLAP domain-containing protein n=1 Tax=Psychrobacillus psychrodurans TaxID=126157 RepID=UPI0008EBF097|nr:SLAP domain-containing protein [Psychrobacillus psychrodurans]MCZ8539032.1 SLAP domain-containing protein [Psychrobacillus psychrodurans]SFM27247.1 accessory Sec system S-layer assembly protein [Psychrobacillus psychrodurans]